MALANNLVLTPKDFPTVAEALSQRQPGDTMRFEVQVTIVESLPERASFDITSVEPTGASAPAPSEPAVDEQSPLAASVLGVMKKKRK